MCQTIILQYKSLTLTHEPEALPDVREAIKNTVLGNPGGTRYRHLDALRKIEEIKPLHFFPFRKDGNLISVLALAERITYLKGIPYYTYYVRYVSFNTVYTVKNLKFSEQDARMQRMGNSFMKEGIKKHAETFPFVLKDDSANPTKKLYYAFVEASNIRSLNYTTFFFEKIRNITAITYSNLFPRHDKRVTLITSSELNRVTELLQSAYAGHSFFRLNKEKLLSNYYVFVDNNEIVAGLQAQVANWKIEELPGWFGRVIKIILPYMPVLSRLIKPKRFTFLTFDTLYCREKYDHLLPVLFRSVCAIKKVYVAMIYIDTEDPLRTRVAQLKKMGMLNKIFGHALGVLVANFINFTDEEKQAFYNSPVYISGYDLT